MYHLTHKLAFKEIAVAVVVQEMLESEISGVLFTEHPTRANQNEALVVAAYGQGEGVVSGLCNTDEYTWQKNK